MSPGATIERIYFYRSAGMPVQQTAFRVQRAGETVGTLDNNTQPTLSQYQAMVGNGDLIRPRSESVGQVMGDVWYKDTWLIPAQLQ